MSSRCPETLPSRRQSRVPPGPTQAPARPECDEVGRRSEVVVGRDPEPVEECVHEHEPDVEGVGDDGREAVGVGT